MKPNPQPTYTCGVCGRTMVVRPDGRGFPPDITKRKLIRECADNGHKAEPRYQAGIIIGGPPGAMY